MTGKEEFDKGVQGFKAKVRRYDVGKDTTSKKSRLNIKGSASAKNIIGRLSNDRLEKQSRSAMNAALSNKK